MWKYIVVESFDLEGTTYAAGQILELEMCSWLGGMTFTHLPWREKLAQGKIAPYNP
jgi:hypothetical protein